MADFNVVESVVNGVMAGAASGVLMMYGRDLPLVRKLSVIESMNFQRGQAMQVVALSAFAGQLLGRPLAKMAMKVLKLDKLNKLV